MQSEYLTIARAIERRCRDAIRAGCDVTEVTEAFMHLEAEICRLERDRLIAYWDLVRQCGTVEVAERLGVSDRTVRRRMQCAIDKICRDASRIPVALDAAPQHEN